RLPPSSRPPRPTVGCRRSAVHGRRTPPAVQLSTVMFAGSAVIAASVATRSALPSLMHQGSEFSTWLMMAARVGGGLPGRGAKPRALRGHAADGITGPAV